MTEKPILFSGAMVRAILDGRKTMTRRVCVPRYDDRKPCEHFEPSLWERWSMQRHCEHGSEGCGCPHGGAGDRLWVRETFCYDSLAINGIIYREGWHLTNPPQGWKPSIFMPRWASRITLEITAVRVERLQDITEADAQDEGAMRYESSMNVTGRGILRDSYVAGFALLWNSINGNRKDKHGNRLPYEWADNPYVWVIEFRRVTV